MRTTEQEQLIRLIRSVLVGDVTPTDRPVTGQALAALFALALAHDMAHLVYLACPEEADGQEELVKHIQKQRQLALYRHVQREIAQEQLTGALEAAAIDFLPLKGAVLQRMYPEPWMRTSSDIDVLIRPEQHEKAVKALEQAGYTVFHTTPHDVSLQSPSKVHVELHHTLIEQSRYPQAVAVLQEVWAYADPVDEGRHEHTLRDEMFYYYHIAHMAKHVENGGCGVRFFTDLWLLDHRVPFDGDKRRALLERGGLATFADYAKRLSEQWMTGGNDPELDNFEQYVFGGGVYGTLERGVQIQKSKQKSRFRYYLSRVFYPYDRLKEQYPVLKKHKILTPVFWVVRWGRVFDKEKRQTNLQMVRYERESRSDAEEALTLLMKQLAIWE